MLQEMIPYYALTLVSFGRWDEVIAEPLPPSDIRMSYAMAYYARGVAYAAKGQKGDAAMALDTGQGDQRRHPDSAPAKLPVSIACTR
jgi:hypothetical protein